MSNRSIPLPFPECMRRSEQQPFLVLGYERLKVNFQGEDSLYIGIIRAVDCDEPALLKKLLTLKRIIGLTPVKTGVFPCAIDFAEALYALRERNPLYGGRGYILTHMPGGGFIRQPSGIGYAFNFETGGLRFLNRIPASLPSLIPLGCDVILGVNS